MLGTPAFACFVGKLVFGCIMFSLIKVMSQTCVWSPDGLTSEGKCPTGEILFERPVFVAFVMVGSMSLALLVYLFTRYRNPHPEKIVPKMYAYVLLPSFLDAVSVLFLMAGSMFIPMSLTMTLKGVRIVYSTVLVMVVFKRKQKAHNWLGVGVAMAGVALAALSAVLNKPDLGSSCLIGVGLILLSEFVRALMVVSEEYLMKRCACDPCFLIGLQGCWETLLLMLGLLLAWLVIPGSDRNGARENLITTFELISESQRIIAILAVIPVLIATHFICSTMITNILSSVHNAMASVLMTALVWLAEIIMHYAFDNNLGNGWGPYSALQLVGFGLVVVALMIYDGTALRVPYLDYSDDEACEARVLEVTKTEAASGGDSSTTVEQLESSSAI